MSERPQLINSRSGKVEDLDEHSKSLLEAEVKPIIACIGTPVDFETSSGPIGANLEDNNFNLKNIEEVNWRWVEGKTSQENFSSNGPFSYVMSETNSLNKSSKGFYPCTGLIVAGITKTGEKISFLSHQNNVSVLHTGKDEFKVHLEKQLAEIKEKCAKGTIDAVIIGGEYASPEIKERYVKVVKLLGAEVKQALGFEPMVINGPKTDLWIGDDVYYDNEKRRVYFVRPKITQIENSPDRNFLPADFPAGQIDKYRGQWR